MGVGAQQLQWQRSHPAGGQVLLRPQAETGTGHFYLSKDETQFSKVATSKGPYQRYLQHPTRTDLLLAFKDTSTVREHPTAA